MGTSSPSRDGSKEQVPPVQPSHPPVDLLTYVGHSSKIIDFHLNQLLPVFLDLSQQRGCLRVFQRPAGLFVVIHHLQREGQVFGTPQKARSQVEQRAARERRIHRHQGLCPRSQITQPAQQNGQSVGNSQMHFGSEPGTSDITTVNLPHMES